MLPIAKLWPITADTLQQSDEDLAWEIMARVLWAAAAYAGIPLQEVTHEMARRYLMKLAAEDSDNARTGALEKGFRVAMSGDLQKAGRLFRSYISATAEAGALKNLALITAQRKRNWSEVSRRGARARRKYTAGDIKRWQSRAASMATHLSNSAKAVKIAKDEGLPEQAVRTIRQQLANPRRRR